jgi:hypothetical protein
LAICAVPKHGKKNQRKISKEKKMKCTAQKPTEKQLEKKKKQKNTDWDKLVDRNWDT